MNLLMSALAIILLLTSIRSEKIKKILFWFLVPIYTIQILSLLTTRSYVGYQFIINLFDYTILKAAFTVYLKYSLTGILLITIIYITIYKFMISFNVENEFRPLFMVIFIVYLITPNSLVFKFFSIFKKYFKDPYYKLTQKELFEDINGKEFIDKNSIKVNINGKPKNLIIIFLESLEQVMLDEEPFKDLTKNIQALAKEGEFFKNIRQTVENSFTMDGVHTAICGNPFIYGLDIVSFEKFKSSNLACLSDILHKVNYYLIDIGGDDKKFAGREIFMKLHKYNEIYGKEDIINTLNISEIYTDGWGVKDLDSFNFAKQKFLELSNKNKPFHILTKTIDIHGPNGEHDIRCPKIMNNSTLNTLKCTDKILGDFIKFLKQQPNYKDTLIVILPDHLYMKGNISKYLDKVKDRRLYAIILNSGKIGIYDDKIVYFDIPKIILDRLGIEHNVNFLMDNNKNLNSKERINFIEKNVDKIKSFNSKTVLWEN